MGLALLLLLASQPLLAVNPAVIMFYGAPLQKPIFVEPGSAPSGAHSFLWGIGHGGVTLDSGKRGVLPDGLTSRLYLKFAVFWSYDRWGSYRFNDEKLKQLKPEDASQHGRLYLPTATEPAVVVATYPLMLVEEGVPIPERLDAFIAGWVLKPEDLATAKRFGIPGL